jgi:hypothetical protein
MRVAWVGGQLAPGTNWGPGLPPPGNDQNSVITLLQELDDIMDALSDLSMSEAVFQILRGNFERSGALLDAVQKSAYAPEPQVVQTQRSGIDLTHRVMALFAGIPNAAPGWDAIPQGPRAVAEPSLDAWAGGLLPNPQLVRCGVTYIDGGTTTHATVALSQLGIGPLDFLTLSDTLQTPAQAELEERIRYAAALAPSIDAITISFDRSGLPADSVTFPEALTSARAVRALVASARAVRPSDLCETQVNAASAGGAVNLSELQSRLTTLKTRFNDDLAALNVAIAGLPAAPDPARNALLACSAYGVLGAIPATSSGPDPSLLGKAQAVSAEMSKRVKALATMPNVTAADAIAQFGVLFSNTVPILPRLQAPNVSALHAAFSASSTLFTGADSHAVDRWIQQLTHVRPAISRLDAACTCAELLGQSAPAYTFAQLPAVTSDRWMGLPLNGSAPPSGRVAIAAIVSGDISTGNDYAGLLIDEWPERIPSSTQTAAVAFHHEEPKSRAPQALLLAVCPDNRETWDDELLLATLQETLQLAKIRGVDLDSMLEVGQILPALYVPFNMEQSTVQTRFRLTETEVKAYHA